MQKVDTIVSLFQKLDEALEKDDEELFESLEEAISEHVIVIDWREGLTFIAEDISSSLSDIDKIELKLGGDAIFV